MYTPCTAGRPLPELAIRCFACPGARISIVAAMDCRTEVRSTLAINYLPDVRVALTVVGLRELAPRRLPPEVIRRDARRAALAVVRA